VRSTILKVINITMEGRYGGPHAFIATCADKLKNFSIETIVVFPDMDSDIFLRKLSAMDVVSKRLRLHRLTKEKKHLIKYALLFIPEVISLYRLYKKECIDIVHCNNSWQFKGVIAGRLARKKTVWHLHETSTPFFINIIFKLLAKNFADAFITAGKKARKYYLSGQRLSSKPILEIQAPVDTLIFDPDKGEKDRKIAKYPGLKIVTVGNVNPLKGIEYFVEMSSILNRSYNYLSFFVIGPHFPSQKAYSEKIMRMAQKFNLNNLYFYGPSENIPSVLKAADIYICSSIAEASPISVWEAMSMGKAIVSTDVGDVAKFIKDGENGFIVPIKDAAALVQKAAWLIDNSDSRKKIGINARKTAIQKLDVDICVKKHAEFYRTIAGGL